VAVPAIGPVVFSLDFDRQCHVIDLSDLPCPRLVRAMAAQLASIGGRDGTVRGWPGFSQMVTHLRSFVVFAAAAEPGVADELGLDGLQPELLEAFENHLAVSYPQASGEPHLYMPVRLDLRRLRKTYKSRQYMRAAGVLDDFTSGHSKAVAAAHYADIDAHREVHEQAIEAGLRQALDVALGPPVVADEHGRPLGDGPPLTPPQVRAALSAESDVFLASCTDFYASPFARTRGSACPVAIWGCVDCPNAVYTARHLPSVLRFLDFIAAQRDELPADEWQVRYELAFERINTGILPQFSAEQLATARLIAEADDGSLALPARILEHIT
jgi:hypothetical protein